MSGFLVDAVSTNNEQNDTLKAPGLIKGTVVKNDDAAKKGYVLVQESDKEDGQDADEELWAHILQPYGGPEHGSYTVPEVGDTVVVGYIGGDMKKPVVLGSIYDDGAAMTNESFDANNYIKHTKTKGGMDILINDEEGKQSITVKTPKGSVITIEDEKKTCMISDEEKENKLFFDYEKGEIELVAKNKITFKSGEVEMVLDAQAKSFSMNSNEAILTGKETAKVDSPDLTLNGSEKVTVTGTQVSIN